MCVLCLAVHAKRFQCHKQQWIHSSQMKRKQTTISLANSVVRLHREQFKNAVNEFPVTTQTEQHSAVDISGLWDKNTAGFLTVSLLGHVCDVFMPYSLASVGDLISCNHVIYWIPFCLSGYDWDTEICVLFIQFNITHKTGNSSHEQPQNNLHYMMTEHKIPANWLKFQTIW